MLCIWWLLLPKEWPGGHLVQLLSQDTAEQEETAGLFAKVSCFLFP